MSMKRTHLFTTTLLMAAMLAACGPKKPAAGTPAPNPFPGATTPAPTSTPTVSRDPIAPPTPPTIIPPDQPITAGDPLTRAAIEDINKDSPLKPVYFAYDSDVLDETARKTMADNAEVLKKYATWVVTIEGHCDERGTAEYNLALGDRRAIAAKNYMVTLGIAAERLRTVSYGNEFPFDPGHDESAWSQNRRAHFMLTSK
jgi:peptidoglycan-associated lipoprotein